MLLKNKAVKAIAGAVILSCIMGGNVYELLVSVYIEISLNSNEH